MLKVYNTKSHRIESFAPRHTGFVLYYACGPSVYNYAHIGNLRTFFWEDILKRQLLFHGYKVRHAMPISDVEDKAVNAFNSQHKEKTFEAFLKPKIAKFERDMLDFGLLKPTYLVRFTKSVPLVKKWITAIAKKGMAWEDAHGNIYFKVTKSSGYGSLARLDGKKMRKIGARLSDDYAKEGRYDFALWKAAIPQDGPIKWKCPKGGWGRPGTHAYCSAIAYNFLGHKIDIHAGGVDNIFPHHENEIAQSNIVAGKGFVKYWFHVKHLTVNKKKMSKSIGNIYYLSDMKKLGIDFQDLRYFYLQKHYRQKQDFEIAIARKAAKGRRVLVAQAKKIARSKGNADFSKKIIAARQKMLAHLDNDLNTPKALKIFEVLSQKLAASNSDLSPKSRAVYLDIVSDLKRILGLELL